MKNKINSGKALEIKNSLYKEIMEKNDKNMKPLTREDVNKILEKMYYGGQPYGRE